MKTPKTSKITETKKGIAILVLSAMLIGAGFFLCDAVIAFADTASEAVDLGQTDGVTQKWRGSILFLIVLLLGTLSFHMKKR